MFFLIDFFPLSFFSAVQRLLPPQNPKTPKPQLRNSILKINMRQFGDDYAFNPHLATGTVAVSAPDMKDL